MIDKENRLQKQLAIVTKALEDMCEEYDDDFDCEHIKECISNKPCYMCNVKIRLAEAKEKLEELTGVNKNE